MHNQGLNKMTRNSPTCLQLENTCVVSPVLSDSPLAPPRHVHSRVFSFIDKSLTNIRNGEEETKRAELMAEAMA